MTERKHCIRCGGSGIVVEEAEGLGAVEMVREGGHASYVVTCPDCGGEGWINVEKWE